VARLEDRANLFQAAFVIHPLLNNVRQPAPSNSIKSYMEAAPLVSIIIPCYNGEEYLHHAIESALAQSYQWIEVIVVDDGSTDGSSEIAKRYPVRYIQQKNGGVSSARNLGLQESRGAGITFLDADDQLKQDAIGAGVHALAEHPECAMAVGDHVFISADGSYLASSRKDPLSAFHYEALLISNFIEMTSSVLFRRSVLDVVGGFNTELSAAEDYDLYLRIAGAYPICCHSAIVAEYRIHETNASRNPELMLTTTLRVLKNQAPSVRGDARRVAALHQGLRTWRRQYGRQLAWQLAISFSDLSFKDRLRKIDLLIREYPIGLFAVLPLRIAAKRRKLRKNLRTGNRKGPIARVATTAGASPAANAKGGDDSLCTY
jgi:glycosyltransferase involved in cell wall biosynthesis